MIQQAELRRLGASWGIDEDIVERDYVLGWALYGLYQRPRLRDLLAFKGGTALRKTYFPDYRFSADLDFTGCGPMDEQALRIEIEQTAATTARKSGISLSLIKWEKTLEVDEGEAYSASLEYIGPSNRRSGSLPRLKLDITFYEQVVLTPVIRPLLHPYSDADSCRIELPVYRLEETVAEKLRALLRRRRARDVYDLWQLTGQYRPLLDGDLLGRVFVQKCRYKEFPVVDSRQLLSEPLRQAVFSSWTVSLQRQIADLPPANRVWDELSRALAELIDKP